MTRFQPTFSSFQPHNVLFDDQRLQRRVTNYLANRLAAHDVEIDVQAVAGRVILRGRVAGERLRWLAEHIARHVAGVLAVRNELRIVLQESKPAIHLRSRPVAREPAPLASTAAIGLAEPAMA